MRIFQHAAPATPIRSASFKASWRNSGVWCLRGFLFVDAYFVMSPLFAGRIRRLITDDLLIDYMLQRPIVVTPLGTRLRHPSEVVLDILPDAQKGAFTKEDGENVADDAGQRVK